MQILLTILIVILALRILFQWLAPLILPMLLKRMSRKFEQQMGGFQNHHEAEKTEVKDHSKSKSSKGEEGDYIDFEEIP